MNRQSLMDPKSGDTRQYLAEHLVEPFAKLRNDLETMFSEFPARFPGLSGAARLGVSMPSVAAEVIESDKDYTVAVEVPGIAPEDIDLSVQNDMLIVKGEKREEYVEDEKTYKRSERSYGAFERHITLPTDAVMDNIEATTENGVLKVMVPRDKDNGMQARKITINHS